MVTFNTSSLYWLSALINITTSIINCSPRIITAQPLTEIVILEIVQKYGVNNMFTSPIFIANMGKHLLKYPDSYNAKSLRLLQSVGSMLTPAVIQSTKLAMPQVHMVTTYGMTDVGGGIAYPINPKKPDSLGSLIPGFRAKIVNGDGERVGVGEIGERSYTSINFKSIIKGYLNNEEANRSAFDSEGWFLTGDIGYFDQDNDLYLVDRKKDMIKYKGFQVAPSELEKFLEKTLNIKDVIIVGIPDDDAVFLCAAVLLRSENNSITADDISKAIESEL